MKPARVKVVVVVAATGAEAEAVTGVGAAVTEVEVVAEDATKRLSPSPSCGPSPAETAGKFPWYGSRRRIYRFALERFLIFWELRVLAEIVLTDLPTSKVFFAHSCESQFPVTLSGPGPK